MGGRENRTATIVLCGDKSVFAVEQEKHLGESTLKTVQSDMAPGIGGFGNEL
jgi:hypothetical protein